MDHQVTSSLLTPCSCEGESCGVHHHRANNNYCGVRVKVKEEPSPSYGYDTDDGECSPTSLAKSTQSLRNTHNDANMGDEHNNKSSQANPELNSTPTQVKVKEEEYGYDTDTDDDTNKYDKKNDGPEVDSKATKNFSDDAITVAVTLHSSSKKRKNKSNIHNPQSSTKKQQRPKSRKQKEKPRKFIAKDVRELAHRIGKSSEWQIKQPSFQTSKQIPLECVQFDETSRRYRLVEEGSSTDSDTDNDIAQDDVILQAMVVFALYRMEKGWGKPRSNKALSIWGGEPANDAAAAADDDDVLLPLDNLWENEIQQLIAQKKLGPNTLNHPDNYYAFPHFYPPERKLTRFARRSNSYIGQLHILAEQAVIQLALHLHENISKDYCTLASVIIHTALSSSGISDDHDHDDRMADICISLLHSARKESSDCFAKTALDDIEKAA